MSRGPPGRTTPVFSHSSVSPLRSRRRWGTERRLVIGTKVSNVLQNDEQTVPVRVLLLCNILCSRLTQVSRIITVIFMRMASPSYRLAYTLCTCPSALGYLIHGLCQSVSPLAICFSMLHLDRPHCCVPHRHINSSCRPCGSISWAGKGLNASVVRCLWPTRYQAHGTFAVPC